jgi:hypothetical protein
MTAEESDIVEHVRFRLESILNTYGFRGSLVHKIGSNTVGLKDRLVFPASL